MNHAVIFTPDDYRKFLDVLKEIASTELRNYVVERPMTSKQAADYLNISEVTLWKRIKAGKIPTDIIHRSAGSVYFLPSELHQYIKAN